MSGIIGLLKLYAGDWHIIVLALCSCLYLIVRNRRVGGSVVLPIILVILVIMNPILYKYIFSKTVYWRLFWMLPDAILIGLGVAELTKQLRNRGEGYTRELLLVGTSLVCTLVIGMCGHNVFKVRNFREATNIYKLPQYIVDICDVIVETDEHPRCICCYNVMEYVRLYSGDIETMYGRDAVGYILYTIEERKEMYLNVENERPDYEYVFSNAVELDYNFIVNRADRLADDEVAERYGFELLDIVDGYAIYYHAD